MCIEHTRLYIMHTLTTVVKQMILSHQIPQAECSILQFKINPRFCLSYICVIQKNTKWQFTKLLNTMFHCYFIFKYLCFVLSFSDFLWLWLVASLYYPYIWYVLGEKKKFYVLLGLEYQSVWSRWHFIKLQWKIMKTNLSLSLSI